MGGRGATSTHGMEVISALSIKGEAGEAEALNVAGMTPMEQGSRYTNAKKTLSYIENKKLDYEKEQLQVIDRHGYVTRAFEGNEHSVGIDLDTRNYMRGKIVTHNHPDAAHGGTFSEADIECLKMGMKEMRASAKEGNYSLKAGKDANPSGFHKAYKSAAGRMQTKMNEVAKEMSSKKWGTYEKFQGENRKAQLAVIDSWYQKNAPRYGYAYTFEPRSENGGM